VISLNNEKLNLSKTQREILTAVINHYHKKGSALKSKEIVETINHLSPGTIRNLMATMKALKLVKSIAGPQGGYLPTELAYDVVGFKQEAEEIPIYRNEELTDVKLAELRLKPPNSSILHVLGDTRDFKVGDRIKIGTSTLKLRGKVVGRDDINGNLLSSIDVAFLSDKPKLSPLKCDRFEVGYN